MVIIAKILHLFGTVASKMITRFSFRSLDLEANDGRWSHRIGLKRNAWIVSHETPIEKPLDITPIEENIFLFGAVAMKSLLRTCSVPFSQEGISLTQTQGLSPSLDWETL